MKKLVFFFVSFAMLAFTACGDKTDENSNGQDTDSLAFDNIDATNDLGAPGLVDDSTFIGIIGEESSMHKLVLYSSNDDGNDTTIFVVDDDVDKTNCHGIVEGSPCQVVFTGDLEEKPRVTYIETPDTYADAIGRWTCDDPDNPGKKIGVELKAKGKAMSINMPRFKAVSWMLFDDEAREISITVQKKDMEDDVKAALSEDGKVLTIENDSRVYIKEK